MSAMIRGLLLPEQVLQSGWFILLATIVGFNTLIYLGLTFAKSIPMPRQIHPRRVRAWLHRFGFDQEARSAVTDIPVPRRPESQDAYEAMRLDISRRDIPQAFSLTGGLIILVAFVTWFSASPDSMAFRLASVCLGIGFLLLAQVLGRHRMRGMTMRIIWATACCAVVAALLAETLTRQLELLQFPMAFAAIVMTACAPVALSWRVALTADAVMFAGVCATSVITKGGDAIRPIVLGVSALLVGATLLRLRLVAIQALSREAVRASALASTDVLTGVLTRPGFLRLLPGLAANAERYGGQLCVMVIDIDRLAAANEQYGVQYGDDVLRTVATTVAQQVRRGDVVARWDGDEFLVAGIGSRPDADQLAARIQNAVKRTGVALGKWPVTVSVGTAAGDPGTTTFDELAIRAVRSLRGAASAEADEPNAPADAPPSRAPRLPASRTAERDAVRR